jgi:hypothetical protein
MTFRRSVAECGRVTGHAAPNVTPTLLVDIWEQNLFNFSRFRGWFAGIEKKKGLGRKNSLVHMRSKFSSTYHRLEPND